MVKPRVDNRDGERVIRSRIGLFWDECYFIDEIKYDLFYLVEDCDCIIVDEAQFLSADDVKWLSTVVDNWEVPVMCYGLRTDFQGKLFEGSRELLALADVIREIKTVCWCGRKATMNARYIVVEAGYTSTGKKRLIKKIVRDGEQVMLGSDGEYVGLCRRCWSLGWVEPNLNLDFC